MTSHRVRMWDIIDWEGFISSISTRIRTVFAHEPLVRPTEWAAYCQIPLHASHIQLLVILMLL